MSKLKHCEVITAIANGTHMTDYEITLDEDVVNPSWDCLSKYPMLLFQDKYRIRKKETAIFINGFRVPAPAMQPLMKGQLYWIPNVTGSEENTFTSSEWADDQLDHWRLNSGLIQFTKEGAITLRQAILQPTVKAVYELRKQVKERK